jgi:hypothetical protein
MEITPEDRMHMESEAVYAAIERGEYSEPGQVTAALDDGWLRSHGVEGLGGDRKP